MEPVQAPPPVPPPPKVEAINYSGMGTEQSLSYPDLSRNLSKCGSCGVFFDPLDTHIHRCQLLDEQEMLSLTKSKRRNSLPIGANEVGEYAKLCDIPFMDIYINAWILLNVGFLERFKKIKSSFGNTKFGFFEHVKGKKWTNVKKLCPKIKYLHFMNNLKVVEGENSHEWSSMNHKYLISKVSQLHYKTCAFCNSCFKQTEEIALLPCLDIVHYSCLKSKFKGFIFFYQKNSDCQCGKDMQEMYTTVRDYCLAKNFTLPKKCSC